MKKYLVTVKQIRTFEAIVEAENDTQLEESIFAGDGELEVMLKSAEMTDEELEVERYEECKP